MFGRPRYSCFLAHFYSPLLYCRVVRCHFGGQVVYFRDTTRKQVKTFFNLASLLILLLPVLVLLPSASLHHNTWFWAYDLLMVGLPAIFLLRPLLLSLRYRWSTFECIDKAQLSLLKQDARKRLGFSSYIGYIFTRILLPLACFIIFFLNSYTLAFIRYSIDVPARNDIPPLYVYTSITYEGGTSDDPNLIKGSPPAERDYIYIRVERHSPDDIDLWLNDQHLYIVYPDFISDTFYNASRYPYFYREDTYFVPASLIKPTNTLHVESGLAKGDWTIEILSEKNK